MNKPVSFPIAKLLKEKGFDEPTFGFYSYLTNKYDTYSQLIRVNLLSDNYAAPTIADVVMWLYEKHGIWISVSPVFEFNDGREDYLTIQGYLYYITVITDNKYNQEKTHADRGTKNSPTEAYEAAFEHLLNNLI